MNVINRAINVHIDKIYKIIILNLIRDLDRRYSYFGSVTITI